MCGAGQGAVGRAGYGAGVVTNSTYYPGDLRRDLLEAAVVVIGESGIGALSLRAVARTVGVSHAAPAHHFGDKAGLFTALATDSFALFAQEMKRAVDAVGSDPFKRLDASGMAYLEFALANRARFEVMFRREALNTDDEEYLVAARSTSALLRDLVVAAQAAGWAQDRDADSIVLALWSMVHGTATLANQGNLPGGQTNDELLALASITLGAVRGGLS